MEQINNNHPRLIVYRLFWCTKQVYNITAGVVVIISFHFNLLGLILEIITQRLLRKNKNTSALEVLAKLYIISQYSNNKSYFLGRKALFLNVCKCVTACYMLRICKLLIVFIVELNHYLRVSYG